MRAYRRENTSLTAPRFSRDKQNLVDRIADRPKPSGIYYIFFIAQ